jgi:hypothetical protein
MVLSTLRMTLGIGKCNSATPCWDAVSPLETKIFTIDFNYILPWKLHVLIFGETQNTISLQ